MRLGRSVSGMSDAQHDDDIGGRDVRLGLSVMIAILVAVAIVTIVS